VSGKRLTAASLRSRHAALCFQRAFPVSRDQSRAAARGLSDFATELKKLDDTGISGTRLYYRFSFDVARWLARKVPGDVSIDWADIEDETRLEELLQQLLHPADDEYFDSGYVSSQEWIDLARSGRAGTDFDWLMAQMQDVRAQSYWAQLYDAADLPLVWNIGSSLYSKTRNVFPVKETQARDGAMRRRPRHVKKEIQRPLMSIDKLSKRRGVQLIDVAMASLAVRHRETYHFNHANPAEVYVADVGHGVAVAVFGLSPAKRFPLECTMGFLIMSNGVPVGYGGASVLFRQVNTGINIFDEYRGSEASFLWVQVMRVYHALVGCTRFIANPYQFGGDNDEALQSGAFWFYYHLGYRPVLPGIRQLARAELNKRRAKPGQRSSLRTLRKLASCDMHLVLPGARSSDLFAEEWLITSSRLATTVLSQAGSVIRREAAAEVARQVARDVGMRQVDHWPAAQKQAFEKIAPFVAAARPADWPATAKKQMRGILRAKGGAFEADCARMLAQHDLFLQGLRDACRRQDKQLTKTLLQ